MKRSMTQNVACLFLLTIIPSCRYLGFDNAIDCPGPQAVDPAPFLGQWQIATIGGEPAEGGPHIVTVSGDDPCELSFELKDSGSTTTKPVTGTLVVTRVGDATIAAVRTESIWFLLKLDLLPGGNQALIGEPKLQMVRTDVEAGSLDGFVDELDDLSVVHVQATSQGLRTYLEIRPNLFEQQAVLNRKQSAPGST